MAANETGGVEHVQSSHTLGIKDQRDRVTLWFGRGILLYIPKVAVLGESGYRVHSTGVRYCT